MMFSIKEQVATRIKRWRWNFLIPTEFKHILWISYVNIYLIKKKEKIFDILEWKFFDISMTVKFNLEILIFTNSGNYLKKSLSNRNLMCFKEKRRGINILECIKNEDRLLWTKRSIENSVRPKHTKHEIQQKFSLT